MNYNEILEILIDKMEVSDFAFGNIPGRPTGRGSVFIEDIGECVEVDQYGGEDKGSDWWSVKYFPDHDVYIKVEGYYTSYDGTDFEGWHSCCTEVKPKEKTIIVYSKV